MEQPKVSWSEPPRVVGWLLLALMIIVNLVIAYWTPSVIYGSGPNNFLQGVIIGSVVGACISQLNLISVWCALAPGRFVVRVPWAVGLLTLMWYALVLGNRYEGWQIRRNFDTADALQLGMVLFVSFIVALIPVYIASGLWGWRLLTRRSIEQGQQEEQYGISLLLAGMAFVSVLLAVGRMILPPGDIMLRSLDNELLYILPVMAGCNLAITVPSLWISFSTWWMTPVYAAGCMFHCLFVTAIEIAALSTFLGSPPWDAIVAIGAINVAQFVWVFATMMTLRYALAFNLLRTKGQATTPFANSPLATVQEAPDIFKEPTSPAVKEETS